MKKYTISLVAALTVLSGSLANAAAADSAVKFESRSIAAGNARSAAVEIAMQPGNLQIDGGARHLLDARFVYDPPAWRPVMSYSVSGKRGHLVIRQPQLQSVRSKANTWNVKLSNHMPMALHVTSGPGNATFNLRSLALQTAVVSVGPGNVSIDAGSTSLKSLKVSAGPGNPSVNLVAPWKHGVSAGINGGIGNTTLRLPASVGARVTVQGAGHVNAVDFTQQGGAYVNSAFGHSKVSVRVSLSAGIGNVYLETGT